ncbi:MAG: hypothetical protein LUD17_08760 [Bacteroidales bacterium]|nr:hypothetical protein [Bacteroidales bacterium]
MSRILTVLTLLLGFMALPAIAQVSLEEYFDAKEAVADNKDYVYGEASHANLEFAESDAFQGLINSIRAELNQAGKGDMRFLVSKDKQTSVVCQRNNKYYVLIYCKRTDVLYDTEDGTASTASTVRANSTAANGVAFTFKNGEIIDANGVSQPELARKMQRSLSALLTEINRACSEGSELNFDNIPIEEKPRRMFTGLWRAYPFSCNQSRYSLSALCDVRGYQVRGINITKRATADEAEDNDKELCICFDAEGTITCVNFSKDITFQKLYPTVTDKRRELEILQFIENFRCYYVNHDLSALETLFSEDAIIITGKVTMKRDPSSSKESPKFSKGIKYEVKDKKRYLEALDRVFKAYPTIDVKFDDIKLAQHPSRENVYAVNLVQTWNSKSYQGAGYSDVGYLHLLFDFPDHSDPRIHVRAWQPLETDEKDIITIDSYDD